MYIYYRYHDIYHMNHHHISLLTKMIDAILVKEPSKNLSAQYRLLGMVQKLLRHVTKGKN